jgi:hypothetical protein
MMLLCNLVWLCYCTIASHFTRQCRTYAFESSVSFSHSTSQIENELEYEHRCKVRKYRHRKERTQ